MKRTDLILLCTCLTFSLNVLAEEKEEDKTITYKLGGKEYSVKESENPELAKFMDKIEEIATKSKALEKGKPLEEEAKAAPITVKKEAEKPKLGATAQSAEDLYNKGDYETAYDHYKELSAQGDADASQKLALMHAAGQGVDQDEAAAHAWFMRSAEQGNDESKQLLKNYKLSESEQQRSKSFYNEVSKEIDEEDVSAKSATRYRELENSAQIARYKPGTVGKSNPDKLKVKKYSREDRLVKKHTATVKKYDTPATVSYGTDRVELKKIKKEESAN